MKTYGITGGIGMGKSASDKILRAQGEAVIDSDVIARQIVEPGEPALGEIAAAFGSEILGADGRLRREELGRRVFGDETARKTLEAILHPRIQTIWQKQIQEWQQAGKSRAFVVIPLLYETGAEKHFAAVICVACSAASQQKRLQARGWDAQQIERRNQAQWPVEKKIAQAQFVVWTEGSLEMHAAQWQKILF